MSISRTPELPIEHNDWVVLTTASNHFAHDRYAFTEYKFTAFRSSIVSSSGRVPIVGIGTVDLEVYAISPNNWAVNYPTKGKRPDTVFLSLKNVLHIPSANVNVFSTHAINQSGYDVVLDGRERGGYLQEYHDFMLEHKAYASIGMNADKGVSSMLWDE